MENKNYVGHWLGEMGDESDETSIRIIHDTLSANHFTTRLKLKLVTDEQLQIMFSGSNKLGLGTMAVLKFKLSQLNEESPLVTKVSKRKRDLPNAKLATTEGAKQPKGLKALDFERERIQDELNTLNEEYNLLQVKLESRENVVIKEPPAIGRSKIICGLHCHHRGHRNSATNPCNMNACSGFTYCGIKDKHHEYIGETNQVKILIKKMKEKIQNLENQLNSVKDFDSQSEYQFIKNMKPRLIAMNKSYEQQKVLLMRHLRLLRVELKGKIPPVVSNDAEQLQILLKKCTKKMQQTIGDEYEELIADTSDTPYTSGNNSKNINSNQCTTSVKANSRTSVNIFTGNISPDKQEAEREQVRSEAIQQNSSASESSSDEKEKHPKKRKKQKRRRKQRENSYGHHRFPFWPTQSQNTMPLNYCPMPYSLLNLPPTEYHGGVPGIPRYNFVPQIPFQQYDYGGQFGVACNRSVEESFMGVPQQHSLSSYTANKQSVSEQNYVPIAPPAINLQDKDTSRSSQPLDALVTAVELTESENNFVDKLYK